MRLVILNTVEPNLKQGLLLRLIWRQAVLRSDEGMSSGIDRYGFEPQSTSCWPKMSVSLICKIVIPILQHCNEI